MFNDLELWQVNREERFYCFLLAHVLLSSESSRNRFCALIQELDRNVALDPNALEIYVEVAALRDYWSRLGDEGKSKNDARRDVLRRIFEHEELDVGLIDRHEWFWSKGGILQSPGRWEVRAIEHLPDEDQKKLKIIKWSFNSKPDILLLSAKHGIFIEAKVESGEDKYEGWCPQTKVQEKAAAYLRLLAPKYHNTKFKNVMLLLKGDKPSSLSWKDVIDALSADDVDEFTMKCLREMLAMQKTGKDKPA